MLPQGLKRVVVNKTTGLFVKGGGFTANIEEADVFPDLESVLKACAGRENEFELCLVFDDAKYNFRIDLRSQSEPPGKPPSK